MLHVGYTLIKIYNIICISGSCKIKLDNGNQSETLLLNKKEQGLYIDSMILA